MTTLKLDEGKNVVRSVAWKYSTFMMLLAGSVGCASVDYGLYKPGSTEEEFNRDESECRKSVGLGGRHGYDPSQILVFINPRYKEDVRSCLQEKGWKLRPDAM